MSLTRRRVRHDLLVFRLPIQPGLGSSGLAWDGLTFNFLSTPNTTPSEAPGCDEGPPYPSISVGLLDVQFSETQRGDSNCCVRAVAVRPRMPPDRPMRPSRYLTVQVWLPY